MTHSPQRSGTFILAPALRTAPGKGRVEPREPARGSPQSPRAGGWGGKGASSSAQALPVSAGGRGRKEEEEEGRANLEPANNSSTGRDLDLRGTAGGRAQGLKGGVRSRQPGKEDGSRARTKWPRRLLRPSPPVLVLFPPTPILALFGVL